MPTLSVCHRATGNSTCLAANRLSSYQRNFTFRVSILSFVCCWGCREGFKKSKIGIPNTSATKCKKDRIKMTYNTNKLELSQATLGVQLSKDKFIYIQMQTSLVGLMIFFHVKCHYAFQVNPLRNGGYIGCLMFGGSAPQHVILQCCRVTVLSIELILFT